MTDKEVSCPVLSYLWREASDGTAGCEGMATSLYRSQWWMWNGALVAKRMAEWNNVSSFKNCIWHSIDYAAIVQNWQHCDFNNFPFGSMSKESFIVEQNG